MKQYNRIMLGKGGMFAKECREEGYIGCGFDVKQDLSDYLYDNWRDFNEKFIPLWMAAVPGKTKVAAGLACGFVWTIAKGLQIGDVVLCPSGEGYYYIGTIASDYYYVPDAELCHRRKVSWMDQVIYRKSMSTELKNSSGSIGTCCNITRYGDEIEALIAGKAYTAPVDNVVNTVAPPKSFDERSLHKLFCNFLRSRGIYAKTIYHEKSSNKVDSTQKWVHPDIIGVQFEDFNNEATLSLMMAADPKKSRHIYSYEMKRRIENDSQLKQYYFQALSNSSWANFGYLVAFEIADGLDEEMQRLNNAFGIGIILMQATEATILYPAREKSLDYVTIEKLSTINKQFCEFISKLAKVLHASKDYTDVARDSLIAICDKVFETDEEIEKYCKEHNIPF